MNEISKEFKDWACSFSGCDGGNPTADIWLCGIEWGYIAEENEKIEYYKEELPKEIIRGETKNPSKEFKWKDSLTYPYGRSFAKLYKAIKGENVDCYREDIENNEILFRLNLYPIAFSSTDHNLWEDYELNKTTGFDSKYLFNTWCFFNRLPFFNSLREEHKPKLIICTGVNYLRDFLMCFGGKDIGKLQTGEIEPNSEKNKTKSGRGRIFYYVKVGQTLLMIIPFLSGVHGLNSNYLLQEMGNEIKDILDNKK